MGYENELFQERVVRVERPSKHWTLLRSPSGEFLGASDAGLAVFDYVDDKAIWESVDNSELYPEPARLQVDSFRITRVESFDDNQN